MSSPYQPPQQEDPYQRPKQAGPYQAPQSRGQYPGAQYGQPLPAPQQYPQYPNPNYQAPQWPSQAPTGYKGEPPLWAPYYGAPLKAAVQRFFKKYATFTGRASRAEYWWWALVSFAVGLVVNIIIAAGMVNSTDAYGYSAPAPGPLSIIGYILLVVWVLATIVPILALIVRRLHDVNMSGWMILLGFIPFVGAIALFVFMLLGPKPEGARFDVPTGHAPGTVYGR